MGLKLDADTRGQFIRAGLLKRSYGSWSCVCVCAQGFNKPIRTSQKTLREERTDIRRNRHSNIDDNIHDLPL